MRERGEGGAEQGASRCSKRLSLPWRALALPHLRPLALDSPALAPHAQQVKRAIEKGNIEGARIYAQNAIRKKTETLNYLKVSAAVAVAPRLPAGL